MNDDDVKTVEPERNRGGHWVTFGAERYRVPPLAFRALQELQDDVESLKGMVRPTAEQMTTIEKIVHAAMVRNYPSLKLGDVSDMLDIGNYTETLGAVLSIAGLVAAKESAPGETGASIGTGSISA